MLVVCLCCLRVVGFATKEGKVICYGNECPLSIFQNMVKIGEANITQVLLVNYVDCREHLVNKIGFNTYGYEKKETKGMEEKPEARKETGPEEEEGMEA